MVGNWPWLYKIDVKSGEKVLPSSLALCHTYMMRGKTPLALVTIPMMTLISSSQLLSPSGPRMFSHETRIFDD